MMFADDCDLYWEQVGGRLWKKREGKYFEKWNSEEIVNGRYFLQERHCTCCLWPGCFVTRGGHRCAPRLPVQTSLMCWQHPQRHAQRGFDAGPWRDCAEENALMMSGGQSRSLHVRLSCTVLTSLSGYQGGLLWRYNSLLWSSGCDSEHMLDLFLPDSPWLFCQVHLPGQEVVFSCVASEKEMQCCFRH